MSIANNIDGHIFSFFHYLNGDAFESILLFFFRGNIVNIYMYETKKKKKEEKSVNAFSNIVIIIIKESNMYININITHTHTHIDIHIYRTLSRCLFDKNMYIYCSTLAHNFFYIYIKQIPKN